MTWAQLAELIMKLSPQELNKDAIIVVDQKRLFIAINLLINKNLIDALDDGEPYLEVE